VSVNELHDSINKQNVDALNVDILLERRGAIDDSFAFDWNIDGFRTEFDG
jgi:hypothetical protein